MTLKIAYCAGHGFNTPGKRSPIGEREWTFNNAVVLAFEKQMKQYEGVELLRTDDPTGKTDVPLITRTNKANKWGADIYISFHHNANTAKWGSWTGVETFVYTNNLGTKSGALARAVHPAIVKAYGLKDRGIKEGNLHIVRETHMPAILVEGGFMDSTIDIVKLRDNSVLENAGQGIAKAVAAHKNLKLKTPTEITKPESKPDPQQKIHVVIKGDTLYGIATKYKISVEKLKSLNGLKSNIISIGQKLVVENKFQQIKVNKITNYTFAYSAANDAEKNRLGKVEKNSVWTLLGISGSYYKVNYKEKIGYIKAKYCAMMN